MNINTRKHEADPSIGILELNGDLDASNYTDAIQSAKELFQGGVRKLVIDLSKVPFMSSAGLMAIHTMTLLFRGEADGKDTGFRAIDPTRDKAAQTRVKIVSPQHQVDQVLDTVGLKRFFQFYPDLESAINSF